MKLVSRQESGLRPPRSTPSAANQSGVTFHWNGPGMGSHDHSECAGLVRGIQRYHMDSNGWNDIAYNWLVCEHGYVFVGRGPNTYNAANGTTHGNATSHACMVMTGSGEALTSGHRAGMRDIAAHVGGALRVHSDWVGTECPGDEIREYVRAGLPDENTPEPPQIPDYPGGFYKKGSTGDVVATIQQRLIDLGYDLGRWGADGDFGRMTDAAVRQFQRDQRIVSDGIVGPVTWLHLWS